MRGRWAVLLLVVALIGAACGSRGDDSDDSGLGDTGGEQTDDGGGEGGGPPADPEAPCGEGDASGATDIGVTDESITIATIQDIGGPVPGLFQGNLDAINAFVAYCNSLGGVNGRELVLAPFDSRLSEHRAATEQACSAGFALVGSGAALDSGGAQTAVDCGIPDVPGFTAETAHAGATNVVQPLPNPPDLLAVGAQRYLAEEFPEAIETGAMFYVNAPVTQLNAEKRVVGYGELGFDFQVEIATDYPQDLNLGPKIEAVRSNNSQYVSMVGDVDNMANLVSELNTQGLEVEIIEFDAEGYQQEFIDQAGPAAEGVRFSIAITPFEEADQNDEMQRYLFWRDQTGATAPPTALGVQTWSAGLLFATALQSLGSDVTREGLLDALHGITEWDGHGIHAQANPGEDIPTECYLYLIVENGEFVRETPDEGFECGDDNVLEVDYEFPPGAGT